MSMVTEVVERELKLRITESPAQITICFCGVSADRDPGRFLEPLLSSTALNAERGRKELVLDFRALERMNSSTVAPILRLLNRARTGSLSLKIVYARLLKWQTLSFSVLKVFATPDGRVEIQAQ